jgi:hypothetical protein
MFGRVGAMLPPLGGKQQPSENKKAGADNTPTSKIAAPVGGQDEG